MGVEVSKCFVGGGQHLVYLLCVCGGRAGGVRFSISPSVKITDPPPINK